MDAVRKILLIAVQAGRHGVPVESSIAKAIEEGSGELKLDQLEFDSLAWMEFCISVELQSGQELTPVDIEQMEYVAQIEDWLRTRA
jgi:acyl carrier protein